MTFTLDPTAHWDICDRCGMFFNIFTIDEATGIARPHPADRLGPDRLKAHLAQHEKATSRSATRPARGRPSRVAKLGYEYVLWARPDPKDRRKRGELIMSQWKVGDPSDLAPFPDARPIERGFVETPFEGIRLLTRAGHRAKKNREYVARSRSHAKSRSQGSKRAP